MKNLICLVIMMLITISAFSTTLVVNQFDGPYYTINDAYDDAVDGDTVLVYPATYLETININKAITLKGIDAYSTVIKSNSTTISISNGNVLLIGLKIIGSSTAISVGSSTPTIEHCIIKQSGTGIYVSYDDVIIRNTIIRDCSTGIYYRGNTNGFFTNNIIYNCSDKGVYINTNNSSHISHVDFYNNVILNCGYGLRKHYQQYDGDIAYNCFFNNSTNTSGVNLSVGNIYIDPLLYDASIGSYYLLAGSPCIDTGNPAIEYNDLDGTRNDMGIFGGPNQWGAGAPTVMDITITPESVTPGETFDIEANGQVK